ncbi:MAG: hypothetical protein ACQCN6_08490 [Candidatus Bathyarchaeia archaeon]
MKCKICSREAQKDCYCILHYRAYQNIVDKYKVWQKASEFTWNQYLAAVQKNSLTGEWAKEVVNHIIEEEQRCQAK